MTLRLPLALAGLLALITGVADAGPTVKPPRSEPASTLRPSSESAVTKEQPAGDRRRIVAILDVRLDGVPKDIATQFESDLEKQLGNRDYWLAPRARVHEMLGNSTKWTDGCLIGKCLAEVRTQTNAELVLLAAISGSGTSFGYVVTLVRTDTGRTLSQHAERCDVCTVNETLSSATRAAVKLLTEVPDTLPDEDADARDALARLEANQDAAHAATKRRHRRAGFVTTLVGVAVAGAGAAAYFLGDHPSYGLATAAAGGGLAVGGMLALTF